MNNSDEPKLIFQYEFDEYEQYEANAKGVLRYAQILLKNGCLYPITFYDPVRLKQDLEERIKWGNKFVAKPGMIVIPEITLENMQEAVNTLEKEGFFDHLVPATSE